MPFSGKMPHNANAARPAYKYHIYQSQLAAM